MKIRNSLPIGEFFQLVYAYAQACRVRLIYMEGRVKTLLTQEAQAKEGLALQVPPEKLQRASDDSADAMAGWTRAMDLLCDTLKQFEKENDLG